MGAELWKFCIVSVVYVVLQYGDSVWVEVLVHLMLSAILFCLVSIAATTWRPLAATWHGKRPEKQKRSNASSAKHKRSNMSSLTIPAAKTRKSSGEIACGLGHPAFSCSQPDVRSPSWTHKWLKQQGFSHSLTEIGSPNKTRMQDSSCDLEGSSRAARSSRVPATQVEVATQARMARSSSARASATSMTRLRYAMKDGRNAISPPDTPLTRAPATPTQTMRTCGLGHPAFSCSQPDVRSSSWTHTWLEKHGFSRTLTEIGSPNKTRTQDSFCDLQVGPRTAAADVPTVPSFIRAEDDSPRKDVKNQHQSTQLFDAAWHGKRPAKHEDISNASSSTMRAARCSRECSGVTMRDDRHTVSAPETPLDRVPVTPTRISWSSSARASATSMMHLRAAIKEGRQAITAPDTPLTRAPVTPTLTEGISRTAGISRVDDAALVMEEMYTADSQANTRRLHKSKSWDISNASSSTMRAARCSRECSGVTMRDDRHTVSAPETPLDRVPVTPTRISWSSSARASATSMMHLRAAIKEGRQAITAPDTPLTRAPVTPTLTEGISRTAGISRVDDAAHKSKSWHCNRHGEASRATRKILPQSPTSQQPRNVSGGSRFDAIAVKKRWATSTRSI